MRLSTKFIEKLKLAHEPAYKLAWKVNLSPDVLSKYKTGYHKTPPNDKRLLRLGRMLGLGADEIFVTDEEKKWKI